MLDYNTHEIIFKDNNNQYKEFLIKFTNNDQGKAKTLDYIDNIDINKWIKLLKFDLSKEFRRKEDLYGCKFAIIIKHYYIGTNQK